MTPDPSDSPADGPDSLAHTASPLLGSLGRLPEVFAALPGAFVLLTPELRIAAVSDEYLANAFVTRAQLVGQSLFDAFPGEPGTPEGDTMTSLRASLQQVLATGQAQAMPVQHYRLPDPATPGATLARYWEPRNTPVRDAHGAICGIIHSVADVTERVQADAAATAQRQRLQEILLRLPAQVATYRGPDYLYDFVNPRYQLPFPGRAFLGRPIREVLPEAAAQGLLAAFDRVHQTGEPFYSPEQPLELDLHGTGQREQFYYNFFLLALRDAQGNIDGLLDFSFDVTEQVRARQLIEEKERQTNSLNAELQAANAKILANNAELERTQRLLRQLTEELEARVLERTQALHHAQVATEQEREQLYQVFEQSPVAIAIMRGPNLRVELANPAVAAIWGREPAQVLGRPYFEAVPDTAGQGFEQILGDVLTTGQPFTITEAPVTLARAHTGQPGQAYVNFVFQPLRDAEGAPVGLVASGTEVTEQVLARHQVQALNTALAASNEALEVRVLARTREAQPAQAQAEADRTTLQRVFEQAPMALTILEGPTHVITLANAGMEVLWGRSAASLLGRPHFEALPDLAGQGFEAIIADVYHTGQPYYLREVPVHVDRAGTGHATLGYYHITYQPLRDGQGHITAITVSAIDVTDQVLARQQMQGANEELETRVAERTAETQAILRTAEQQREQLREQQGLLRQILGQVPASVATLSGPEHRFSFFNDHYLALTDGRARLGGTVAELLPEVVEQGFIDLLDRVYTTGEPFLGSELSILLHPAGASRPTQRYLDFVYQPLTDGQGRTLGILVFAVDVTDKVLARRQAETLQAAVLAAVQRQKEDRENVFQLFEQSPAVICLLREPEHRIEYLNPAYQALFPGQPLRGRSLAAVQPTATALVTLLDGIYQNGTARFQPGVPITITPLGGLPPRTRYFDFTYQAYREQERIAGVSIFGLDVTEQVLARRKVLELNAELQARNLELGTTNQQLTRTNADLDTFVYTASHDLKVPIANIEGLLDALSRDLRNQEAGAACRTFCA
ncbi:PAS domain-containing protein [Hymenobacter sp. BRD128]|uniref:PAS domain-containing protein n=1 Tax=Hymenobacter sp. BRD128 TaxID=2675878 RepID=UPI00156551D1|nr:PAS domain-containing protein [Hymenobacter sp. BRD128]QKG58448.1 PAS domain-containing protein [Hymenobacter sp. BRD128]